MHLHHLWMFYHASTQHASVHPWIPQHHAKYLLNLHKYTTHHLGIYLTLSLYHPKIPEYLYCERSRHCFKWYDLWCTCSSIHLPLLIQPFCWQSLKLSINFGSIAKDSYSSPPFSEINRYLIFFPFPFLFTFYFFFLLHFSSFLRLSFVFHVSDLCVFSFIPFRLLFPNIFKYLHIHVFVVSQYFEIRKFYFTPQFAFCLQLIIVSAPHNNLSHHLAHHVHSYHLHHP